MVLCILSKGPALLLPRGSRGTNRVRGTYHGGKLICMSRTRVYGVVERHRPDAFVLVLVEASRDIEIESSKGWSEEFGALC